MKKGKIIAGFTGTGKSSLAKEYCPSGLKIRDFDSADFSHIGRYDDGVRNPEYPGNYVKAIIDEVGRSDVILISVIPEVVTALINGGCEVTLVYPTSGQKQEYSDRYHGRRGSKKVAEMLTANFDTFLGRAQSLEGCKTIVLEPGQYLADVLPKVLT